LKPHCALTKATPLPQQLPEIARWVAVVQSGNELGSGVMVDRNGLLLTAAHVLHGQKTAVVYLPQREAMLGNVVKIYQRADLALLKLPIQTLGCLPLASTLPALKSRVYVLGFTPKGQLQLQMTETQVETRTADQAFFAMRLTLMSGNSGGPILNEQGQLVGIINARVHLEPDQNSSWHQDFSVGVSTLFLRRADPH
jgi:serine protease Do